MNNQNAPQVESDVFSTIKRIDEKVDTLYNILEPIIQQIPSKVGEEGYGTKLANDLHRLENRITELLDCIRI